MNAAALLVAVLAASTAWGTVSLPATPQQRGPAEDAALSFLAELQRAVAADDRAAVAALVRFPLTVWAGGIRIPVADRAAFIQQYDVIFPVAMRQRITSARGLPLNGGVMETVPVGDAMRIARINVPLGDADVSPPAAAAEAAPPATSPTTAPRRPAASLRDPLRLTFRAGTRSVQWIETLVPGETDAYVVYARKGQLLGVRIERVRGREAVARILDAKSGKPLNGPAAEGARTWAGRVPADGDYRIEILRPLAGAPLVQYSLTVSVR